MTASLTLTYGALDLTDAPYLIEFGMDVGAPQNVTEALAFLLQDGEVELSSRASNRTLTFTVLLEGADLSALAAAEAALVAESKKPLNTLTVDPGDGAPATVFETYPGQVVFVRDDDYERARYRAYQVTVRAMPAGRSVDETTTTALSATGSTTTLVDNGSSATGWTGTVNGASTSPSVSSGAVGITTSALSGDVTVALTRTGSITTSSTKFLAVDYLPATGGGLEPHAASDLTLVGDGVTLARIATVAISGTTYRSTFAVPSATSSIASLTAQLVTRATGADLTSGSSAARSFYIDNINRTDIRPSIGSARQQLRTLQVGGSVRGPGTLTVSASTSLGDVGLYVWRKPEQGGDLYVPAMSPFRATARTTDATLLSGGKDTIAAAGSVAYDIPAAGLLPGAHGLVVRLATADAITAGSVSWTAQTRINATAVGAPLTGSRSGLTATGTQVIYPLGRLNLPVTQVLDATTATLRLTLTNNGSTAITLDELWLFNLSLGSYVQVACGSTSAASGGASKRLFVLPATTNRPYPSVLRGHAADGSDAFNADVQSWQFPEFCPPEVSVFMFTTNATDADASFSHFKRWHTNAAA